MAGNPLRLTLVFVGVVAVGLLVGWVIRSQPTEVATLGSRSPDFAVELLDGGEFSLSSHLDSTEGPVVLNLWASWCIPCRTEMPDIDAFSRNNPDVTVLGVAVQDQRNDSLRFAEEVDVSYPLAFGNDRFENAFPAFGLPATYVINPSGTITAIHRGIVDEADLEELISR